MKHKYLIGTGFWTTEEDRRKNLDFFYIWYRNTAKAAIAAPFCVVNCSEHRIGLLGRHEECMIENLGHIGRPPVIVPDGCELDGWAMSVIISAMAAYAAQSDFIYKEQDCLAFGDWVGELYRELEAKNAKMLTGRVNKHLGLRGQSLFIIKWSHIPLFVREFITVSLGSCSKKFLGEQKFDAMMKVCPWMKEMDIGYDRMRPASWKEPIYYVQQLTDEELKQLKEENLI